MQKQSNLLESLKQTFDLAFPNKCVCCDRILIQDEQQICTVCLHKLPVTDFENFSTAPEARYRFEGKVRLMHIIAVYWFNKGGLVQDLIHEIKYNSNTELIEVMGSILGYKISQLDYAKSFDVVLPIPLHADKLKTRGYNQAELLANPVAKRLGKELSHNLVKKRTTESQTQKGRWLRWLALQDSFELNNAEEIKNKNVLLIDDVLTTGATIELAAKLLLDNGAKTVSCATLAIAQ